MDPRTISPLAGGVLDRLLEHAVGDDRLVGVTLGGSGATGTLDEHSDLDFVLVCRDGDHGALLGELPRLAAALGPLLASFSGEHVGVPSLLIALYGPPPLHVDLKLTAQADLAARAEDGVVLWQRDGAVTEAYAAAPAAWPQPDAQWIEDRFWVWIHYSASRLARGELFEVLDALTLLRAAVLGPLIAVRAGARPQGVRRLEQIAPERVDALTQTIGDHTRAGCHRALRAAAALYVELRDDRAVTRRAEAEREALAHLDAVAGTDRS